MATTAKIAKEAKPLKFKIRHRNRCKLCGRPRAYMRKFAHVPPVLPQAGARRRRDRGDEELLVREQAAEDRSRSCAEALASWT